MLASCFLWRLLIDLSRVSGCQGIRNHSSSSVWIHALYEYKILLTCTHFILIKSISWVSPCWLYQSSYRIRASTFLNLLCKIHVCRSWKRNSVVLRISHSSWRLSFSCVCRNKIPGIVCPILFISGLQDDIIPPEHMVRIICFILP